jgi:hypothetical protein
MPFKPPYAVKSRCCLGPTRGLGARILAVESAIDFAASGNRFLFSGEKFTIIHHRFSMLFHYMGSDLTAFFFEEGLRPR